MSFVTPEGPMQIMRAFALLILSSLYFVVGLSYVMADSGATDRLDFGDRVTVTVFGQPDMSGTFQINGDGNIELPMVGAVQVGDQTVEQAKERIKERLASGYLLHPAVSITVTERRPIYVVGDVKSPGTFPFRHGSTVMNAVAQAGGYGTNLQAAGGTALVEYLLADERVQVLEASRLTLNVRRARLEAQLEGQDDFAPPILPNVGVDDAQRAELIEHERDTLRRQREAVTQQLAMVENQKPKLEVAVAGVERQIEAERKQQALVHSQLEDWQKMKAKGLGLRATEVSLLREVTSSEILISGFRTELARLQMSMGELDMKIQEAQASDNRRVAGELQDTRTRLSELDTSLPAARRVREIRQQQAENGSSLGAEQSGRRVVIRRSVQGSVQAVSADEQTPLQPGDIVEVIRLVPAQMSGLGHSSLRQQAQLDGHTFGGARE
jgi:polysaccharide export outer membrane protein